jgi:hypothetical protein
VAFGDLPTVADPVKADDLNYSYTFKSWTPAVTPAYEDATYTAVFEATSHYDDEINDSVIIGKDEEKNDITGDVTFNVHQMKARGRDVPDWKFKVMPVGGWGMPEQLNAEPKLNDTPDNIKHWLEVGHNDIEWPATKEKIKSIFKNRGGVTNKTAQDGNLKVALNRRFVIEQPKDTWTKGQNYVKYILNPEEFKDEDPFGPQREDAPF